MPYALPGIGNMLPFAFDTKSFVSTIVSRFGPNVPVRIRVLNMKVHFITGSESILAIFRASRDLTTAPASILALENAFGSPVSTRHAYERDNTGIFTQPLEGTNLLEPHNREFNLTHKTLHSHLSGTGLNELATRFLSCLETELLALDIGHEEWTAIPDFYTLIKQTVFKESTTAMCGPNLFSLNPDFTDDFWEFDTHIGKLFKNLPRWMIPKSFQVRDKLITSITKWHAYAEENFDKNDEALQNGEWEELYGARLMRQRHEDFTGIDDFNDEAYAASDLGMIWGANANIVPIIGWSIIDTLVRPELLIQARKEIASLSSSSGKGAEDLNMPKLLASPLLQSIYSEELRLRNGVMIQRVPLVDNFKVPNDPNSGPAKPGRDTKPKPKLAVKDSDNVPKYTTDSVTGSYIPYGGGQKICPGRFYAKQEAIGAMSLILSMFDIELKNNDLPQPDMDYFPYGVVPPLGTFPARMRRRKM
ncbi:related to cytochrome p450 7a1 [Rhynchosporium agropyri]|uniref:Related to cytochrome p450 7a1 n=1 Tax=Rhynchosporium agropyri TaxID=914238 RepID=A0A1E1KC02_9HELO|nr:related to cytochrome p450 7a1 [Rhynchosporium agropyri]